MSAPRVSIGLPVWNGAAYVQQALDSIAAQSMGDFELLIGDNGSDDGTAEICAAFAAGDARVRVLRSETNRGASWNYNRLVGEARGALFKWAAYDDWLAEDYLLRCVDGLEANPDAVLCYPATTVVQDDGAVIGPLDYGLTVDAADPIDRYRSLRSFLSVMRRFQCNAVFGLHRTEVLRSVRPLRAQWGTDAVLLAELALRGRFVSLPEPLFFRREHDDRSMRSNTSAQAIAEWFGPLDGRSPYFPQWRCFRDHIRAVSTSDLGLLQRVRCHAIALRTTPWRPLVRELRRAWRRRGRRRGIDAPAVGAGRQA